MTVSLSETGVPSERQLRQACAELDRKLRSGERCRAEHFFADCPLLAGLEDHAVELIYTEFVAREELGQRPTPEEFFARFPSWQARLRRQFQVHELLRDNLAADGLPAPPAAPTVGPGGRLGPYELLDEVARGGCGVVYRAWQHGLERVVAVKALRPEFGRLVRARQRFCHEARVMAALRHRHIMPVHDIGEAHGVIYFSMDFAAAGSLVRRVGAGDPQQALRLLETVARAVHHAHRHGVIHCDLKPSNVLLDDEGEPLVTDFGLARLPTGAADPDGPGALVGTPAYMAPEQVDGGGRPVGPATDVWALGVMLYELLCGVRPFHGGTLAELQEAICGRDPVPLGRRSAGVDHRLDQAVARCLDRDPAERWASAGELADELRLLRSQPGCTPEPC